MFQPKKGILIQNVLQVHPEFIVKKKKCFYSRKDHRKLCIADILVTEKVVLKMAFKMLMT